jgi:hypothetical protein
MHTSYSPPLNQPPDVAALALTLWLERSIIAVQHCQATRAIRVLCVR